MKKSHIRSLIIIIVAALVLYALAPLGYERIKEAQRISKSNKAQLEVIANFEGSWLLDSENKPDVNIVDEDSVFTYDFQNIIEVSAEKISPIEGEFLIDIHHGGSPDIISRPSFGVSRNEKGYFGGGIFFAVLFRFSEGTSIM